MYVGEEYWKIDRTCFLVFAAARRGARTSVTIASV